MSRLANTIEAILYLKAQPLKIAQLAEFAKCDKESAEEGLIELMGEYAHRESALEIAETEEGYALQLREVYKPLVNSIVPLDIGLGALRTLAAIALRGPIAQSELVELRGSGVYQHVPDLVEQGFVKKRRQSDGRSSWLQITEKFYQHFEIDKLPQISDLSLPTPKATKASGDDSEPPITTEATTEIESAAVAETPDDSAPDSLPDSTSTKDLEEATTTDHLGQEHTLQPAAASHNPSDSKIGIAEEIAVLSGSKPPSAENAPLSDAALESAALESATLEAQLTSADPQEARNEKTEQDA